MRRSWSGLSLLLLACAPALTGCQRAESWEYQRPVPEVVVAQPVQTTIEPAAECDGWIEPSQTVEIRAPFQGMLLSPSVLNATPGRPTKPRFREGSLVKQGDVLFLLARNAEQASRLMVADAARRQSSAGTAAPRGSYLQDGEEAASGAADAAEAAAEKLKSTLDCVEIVAPIGGRVARRLVDDGNLVGGRENTLLTTIVATDPVQAFFEVDEPTLRKLLEKQTDRTGSAPEVQVSLGLADEPGHPRRGRLEYLEHRLDRQRGKALAKAVFDNREGALLLGMAARVRVPLGGKQESLLVESRAICRDAAGDFVFVVGSGFWAEPRYVEHGESLEIEGNLMRVVRPKGENAGLRPSDRYIVEGFQRVRPGMQVSIAKELGEQSQPAESAPAQPLAVR